jgi:hypothetical protein
VLRIIGVDRHEHRRLSTPTQRRPLHDPNIVDSRLPLTSTRNHIADRIESAQGVTTERVTLRCARCADPIRAYEYAVAIHTARRTGNTGRVYVHVECTLRTDTILDAQDQPYLQRAPLPESDH